MSLQQSVRETQQTMKLGAVLCLLLVATAQALPSFFPSLVEASPCCSWNKCGECGSTTGYCKANQANCEGCGGQWCPNGASGGGGGSGYNAPNVCSSTSATQSPIAFACMDWNVGSAAMVKAAEAAGMGATHFFGVGSYGSDGSNMGKCYEVQLQTTNKIALLQVVNQGGDVNTGQFDLQMSDGGVGLNNGCVSPTTKGATPMFAGPDSNFGMKYGGWQNKADCSKLPVMPSNLTALPEGEPSLPRLCELGFEMGVRVEGGENPKILGVKRVPCPKALVAMTGLDRSDGASQETHGSGVLSRMMDCCKPSAGWTANVKMPDAVHKAVIPCTSDGYTRIAV